VGRGMEVKPPRFAEAVVRWLLPLSCVEHVLGDLQERMQGAEPMAARKQYVIDAVRTVPSVILSRVFRRCDARLLYLYLTTQCVVFAGYGLFSPHLQGIQVTAEILAKIWWFTLAVVVYQLIQDAYRPKVVVHPVFNLTLILYLFFLTTLGPTLVAEWGFLGIVRWFFERFTRRRDRRTHDPSR